MSKPVNHPPDLRPVPDPEVRDRPLRRRFTAEYKLAVLREADACSEPGQIGALLRREGLYSSHLSDWRKKRAAGELQGLAPRKRGRKRTPKNPLAEQVARLERDKAKLEEELRKARLIIDVQKKLSEVLALPTTDRSESSS
jgi:transposase-like protein